MSLGTGGTGGIYYPLGGALASLLSLSDSSRQYTAEVTGGSVENVNRLREGQIDIGFALSVSAYEAYHGGQDYVEPFETLRIVAPLYPNLVQVLVPRGSRATSLEELAGKRISVGSAGSGTEQVARQLLEAYGMSYDDVEERFLTFSESAASSSRTPPSTRPSSPWAIPRQRSWRPPRRGARVSFPWIPVTWRSLGERYPYYIPPVSFRREPTRA